MTYTELKLEIMLMSAKDIILTMIDAIKNPVTRLDMETFGRKENDICYGCAAINTICKIGGLDPQKEIYSDRDWHFRKYTENEVIEAFEEAIDHLRLGDLYYYNILAKKYGFSTIRKPESLHLPWIHNGNYKDESILNAYVELANHQ